MKYKTFVRKIKKLLTGYDKCANLNELLKKTVKQTTLNKIKKLLTTTNAYDNINELSLRRQTKNFDN